MLKRYIAIFISLFSALACMAQMEPAIPVITGSDLPDAGFSQSRTFSGESLYGYIDGGADLYLEYGFKSASVIEFTMQKSRFKVEIFRMSDPLAAFGIFSVARFKCSSHPGFTELACLNRYQLQLCKGDFYVSIINNSGSATDSVNSVRIGKIITAKINEPAADILWFFPDSPPAEIRQNAVLARGKLGLMNGAAAWENYFRNAGGYTVVVLPMKERTLLSVRFDDPEDFKLFMALRGWGTCDLSASDLKMQTGETIRLLSELHLLIGLAN